MTMSTETFTGHVNDQGGEVINITNPAYGAKGDTVLTRSGGSITAGTAAFTQSRSPFVQDDVGKVVTIQGAGLSGSVLTSKIVAVLTATTATLAHPALTTVRDAGFSYGTDDTKAILAAITEADWLHTIYAPAGIYTILGASNPANQLNGGKQLPLVSRGGLLGAGGKYVPGDDSSFANTIFLCADANIGLRAEGHARYEGFMVDGNNIATAPLKSHPVTGANVVQPPGDEPAPTGGYPTGAGTGTAGAAGTQYAAFIDVWVTRSAETGWWIFGSQNLTFYDCGVTDCAKDGVYFDFGTGGHDFFNFYERGSLRYGIYRDNRSPGGGFLFLPGDVNFFGGTLDSHPSRQGVSKIHYRAGLEWGIYDMDIVGTNLSGPTIYVNQTLTTSDVISRCRIWATPKGSDPGNACIEIGGTSEHNGRQHLLLKTDGCSFMSGDNSVLVTEHSAFDVFNSRGWMLDATTYGPATVAVVEADSSISRVTLPDPDVLLVGRTGRWRVAELASPWKGTVEYRLMADGWVQLKGRAESPTGAAGRMFVLPVGYRPRDGAPTTCLVAVGSVTDTELSPPAPVRAPARRGPAPGRLVARPEVGLGELSIQNGFPTNVNAGAVSYTPVTGSGPYEGGTVVYLDGCWLSVRGNTGQLW